MVGARLPGSDGVYSPQRLSGSHAVVMPHIVIPSEPRNLLFSYGLGHSQLRFGKCLVWSAASRRCSVSSYKDGDGLEFGRCGEGD
jgi:hypothetical protein